MADNAVTDAQVEVSYITSAVSWTPFYELKVDEVSKPVQLVMKANLIQSTGENWEKAKLTFSTGKPAVYKVIPILSVWYLNYYTPQRNSNYKGVNAPEAATDMSTMSKEDSKREVPYNDALRISQ